eukprot:Tbor_TRINITY_DN10170_c0_g1::TRINITY_DN10170_c0_g1_i1::g.17247::m.17247
MPQYVNMLMVAYYNLGVSIECTQRPGYISNAIEAYQLTLDTYTEFDKGLPSTTADAAAAALDRLRKTYQDPIMASAPILGKYSPLPHLSHTPSNHTTPKRGVFERRSSLPMSPTEYNIPPYTGDMRPSTIC